MNEKFNKNAKVEQLTKVVLSNGEEKGVIVTGPLLHDVEDNIHIKPRTKGLYRNIVKKCPIPLGLAFPS